MKPDQIFLLLFGVLAVALYCRSAIGRRSVPRRPRSPKNLADEVGRFAGDPAACRREVEMLTTSLEDQPECAEMWFQRGLYHQALDQNKEACEDFARAIELSPNDVRFLLYRGQDRLARGEADAGLGDLDQALLISPGDVECRLLRATALLQAGRFLDADKDLEAAVSSADLDGESLLTRAELRWSLRFDYDGAAADAEAAMDHEGLSARALHLVGSCRNMLGRKAEAIEAIREAASLDATTPVDLAYRGYARFSLNDVEAARQDLLAARETGGDDLYSRRLLASVHLGLGEMDEALVDVDFVLSSETGIAEDYILRATILSDRGDYRGAVSDYERVLRVAPHDGMACNNFGWLLATCMDASVRNGHEAVRLAERANELMPAGFPYSKGTLAAAWAECGDFAQAIRYEEEARELTKGSEREEWEFLLDLYRSGKPYRAPLHDSRDRARKRLAAALG